MIKCSSQYRELPDVLDFENKSPLYEVYNSFMLPEVESFEHELELKMPENLKYSGDTLLIELSGVLTSSFEVYDSSHLLI